MEPIFNFIAIAFTSLYGIAALLTLGFIVYWLFNKKAKQKHIAELRAQLDELKPTDPEYNAARALYVSMIIGASRSDGILNDSDISSHSGVSHSDGASSDSD